MLLGCAGILIAASQFVTEVPEMIRVKLETTNETTGVFVQTKRDPSGRSYVSRGTYRIRPGKDFEWVTKEPFEARFHATPEHYVYSNEEETVTRALKSLPGVPADMLKGKPDLAEFFRVFDAQYKEESGRFFMKAKPKVKDLKTVLDRIEAEGVSTNWFLRVTFPNRTELRLDFRDNP